ncbi:STE20-related kinase adapter protein alpha-like [Sycon ciliatum]|uniref:STE20-related kinase adapter protein alpha-like n=1 Tax=Sycon ciliatum TaxID=27933 RepID=UPI0020AEDB31|eukprot:scpid80902/ scgid32745/ STE20-related kinase adapter protein alpha; STE20-related adapter protein
MAEAGTEPDDQYPSGFPIFAPEDFELICAIGSAFRHTTVIYLARHVLSDQTVVIRRCNADLLTDDELQQLAWEAQSSHWLQHSNVSPFLASFVAGMEVWTVGQLMHYGSCSDIISAGFPFGLSELVIAFILYDTLQALAYLHRMGYIHRGVTLRHLLVGLDGHSRLGGQRCMLDQYHHGVQHKKEFLFDSPVTTFPWLAPEVLEQNLAGYDYKSDIYSIGVCAVELAHGVTPFADMTTTQMLLLKLTSDPPTLVEPPTGPKRFSAHFHSFVNSCLDRDPGKRPSATRLLLHPFFKQIKRKDCGVWMVPQLIYPVYPLNPENQEISGDEGPLPLDSLLDYNDPPEPFWDFDTNPPMAAAAATAEAAATVQET